MTSQTLEAPPVLISSVGHIQNVYYFVIEVVSNVQFTSKPSMPMHVADVSIVAVVTKISPTPITQGHLS